MRSLPAFTMTTSSLLHISTHLQQNTNRMARSLHYLLPEELRHWLTCFIIESPGTCFDLFPYAHGVFSFVFTFLLYSTSPLDHFSLSFSPQIFKRTFGAQGWGWSHVSPPSVVGGGGTVLMTMEGTYTRTCYGMFKFGQIGQL